MGLIIFLLRFFMISIPVFLGWLAVYCAIGAYHGEMNWMVCLIPLGWLFGIFKWWFENK